MSFSLAALGQHVERYAWYDFLAHYTLWLALGAGSAVFTSAVLLGAPVSAPLVLAPMLLAVGGYNINRKTDLREDRISNPSRFRFLANRNYLFNLAALSLAAALLLAFLGGFGGALVLIALPIAVMAYSVQWLPPVLAKRLGFRRFKEVLFVKNLWVSLAWGLLALYPIAYAGKPTTTAFWGMFAFVSSRLWVNTVTFDIRDVEADRAVGVRTIPNTFGEEKTRLFLYQLNTASGILLLWLATQGILPRAALALLGAVAYGYYFIHKSADKASIHFLCDIIVDGEIVLWAPLVVLGRMALGT